MNLCNDGKTYGIEQYCFPFSYELAGREFILNNEKGSRRLAFRDREFGEDETGGQTVLSQYRALKLTDSIILVICGERLTAVVLDLEAGTAAVSEEAEGEYGFYTLQGYAAAGTMPGYTADMAGTRVQWTLGCGRYLELDYLEDGKCGCIWSPRRDRRRELSASCIQISPSVYLAEINGTSPFRTDFPQGYSRMILLQDFDRLLMTGCLYSPALNDPRMISGYAMVPQGQE